MKFQYKSIFLSALLAIGLTACATEDLDDLTGKYGLDDFAMSQVDTQTTDKIGKGVKRINLNLKDSEGNILALAFGSKEWELQAIPYSYMPSTDGVLGSAVADGGFDARITRGGVELPLGAEAQISVNKDAQGIYSILLISITADGSKNIRASYRGPIEFTIGEDDPEASGYTLTVSVADVVDANQALVPGVSKYVITVSDPTGNAVAEFDAISQSGKQISDLTGSYNVCSYASKPFEMDNGWVVYMPEYGLQLNGGTSYVDSNGVRRFVTGGTINITKAEDAEGKALYSFSGEELPTLTSTNEAGSGSFNIRFVSAIETGKPGTVLSDLKIQSTVLGQEMKYSVYLPASYDGEKTFPVLYLLHGMDGGNNDWLTGGKINEQIEAAVATDAAPEMIVVMPDGKNSFYSDGFQDGMQYMTYFFTEFMPAVESSLKVKSGRGNHAIGGLSMGGYGSIYYGWLHPEIFGYVYAVSPATYMDGLTNLYDLVGAALAAGGDVPGMTIEIGTEDFLFESAGYFEAFLGSMNVAHEYVTRSGAHDWAFWSAAAPKIVRKVGEMFSKN